MGGTQSCEICKQTENYTFPNTCVVSVNYKCTGEIAHSQVCFDCLSRKSKFAKHCLKCNVCSLDEIIEEWPTKIKTKGMVKQFIHSHAVYREAEKNGC